MKKEGKLTILGLFLLLPPFLFLSVMNLVVENLHKFNKTIISIRNMKEKKKKKKKKKTMPRAQTTRPALFGSFLIIPSPLSLPVVYFVDNSEK